jgi:hypothetical protein
MPWGLDCLPAQPLEYHTDLCFDHGGILALVVYHC